MINFRNNSWASIIENGFAHTLTHTHIKMIEKQTILRPILYRAFERLNHSAVELNVEKSYQFVEGKARKYEMDFSHLVNV